MKEWKLRYKEKLQSDLKKAKESIGALYNGNSSRVFTDEDIDALNQLEDYKKD